MLNAAGGIHISQSFSAFGQRRDPTDWDGAFSNEPATADITQEGFTGHTHLDSSPLLHLGGRVLDTVLGRFMAEDPGVPYPQRTQSHNRYSYTQNNPLSRTDPDGFFDWGFDYRNEGDGSHYTIRIGAGSQLRQARLVPATGCIKASARGCYGKLPKQSVFDMIVDAWNKPMIWQTAGTDPGLIHTLTDFAEHENIRRLFEDIGIGVLEEFVLLPARQLMEGSVFAAACSIVKLCRVLERWGGRLFDKAVEKIVGYVKRFLRKRRGVPNAGGKPSTLEPGPFAKESIPAHRGRPTAAEQRQVNDMMEKHGCHTCGTKNPGTKSGNAVADHQPAQALGDPKEFYPHCIDCARRQGGEVLQEVLKRRGNQ